MKNKHLSKEYKSIIDAVFIDPLVDEAVAERPKTQLETEEHFRKRLKSKLTHSIEQYQQILTEAIHVLEQHKKWPSAKRLKQSAEKLATNEFWQQQDADNKVLQDFLEITDEELQSFYQIGSDLFQQGALKAAGHIFLLLTQLNPKVAAFWMAFGITEDKIGEPEMALYAYLWAAELDNTSLDAYTQAAKCCLLLHQPELAKKLLRHALERGNENAALNKDKKKVEQMLHAIGK